MAERRTLEGDAALLAGFRRGDRDALSRVYRLYVDDVAAGLRRGVRVRVDGQIVRVGQHPTDSDLEVLVQDTFVRAFSPKARDAFDGLRPFGAWLSIIARNVAIDRARAERQRRVIVPLDDVDAFLADDADVDATTALEAAELDTLVTTTVAALPERERELYRLRFVEGQQQKEVATALGLSVITIRRLDARVRATLLRALQAAGHLQDRVVGIPATIRDRTKG
ncbi:MAG TPA: RNA polymerase sigma factor [Myxococcota bacterium]